MAAETSPDDRASTRWPWLRSALYGAVVALSPAAFVLETQSCSGPSGNETTSVELTGIDLVARMNIEPVHLVWMSAIIGLAFLAPFLARLERRPLVQLAWHVVALLTAAFVVTLGVAVISFAIFASRVLRPAGHLALVLLAMPVIESFVRIVLSIRELRSARPASRGDPPSRVDPPPD